MAEAKKSVTAVTFRGHKSATTVPGPVFKAMLNRKMQRRAERRLAGRSALGTGVIGTAVGGLIGGRPGALVGLGAGAALGGIRGYRKGRKTSQMLNRVGQTLRAKNYDV